MPVGEDCDITELKQYEIQLLFQATCDVLTTLPNRRYFTELLEQAIKRAVPDNNIVAIVLIDLDDFKDINYVFGHVIGDQLLQVIARRLSALMGESDTLARVGGDEFAVLVEDADKDCEQIARRMLMAFSEPYSVDGHEIFVGGSMGISLFPFDADHATDMLRNADIAMYRAKQGGKNKYQCYTFEMSAATQLRMFIGNRLRYALKQHEFTLHYQPKVKLSNGEITGLEALIRWDATGISPAEFIPIAEQNGLIVPIGEWVLRAACRQAKQCLDDAGHCLKMSVNLSARQFRSCDIVKLIACILEETALPPSLLEIELTESMIMHDGALLRTLESLKDMGVSLAVDDFGVGYSSLSYLKKFPIDALKIDRSFITDVTHDKNDKAIVSAIIVMAHSLGLKVIAEGVETADQLDFLRDRGCDEIQGYYFSKPLAAKELMHLLRVSK